MATDKSNQQLHDVLATARAISATATEDHEWEMVWTTLRSLRPLGRIAFDGALELLHGDYWDRSLGCDLLGTLCNPDEDGWTHEAAVALAGLARTESDPQVLQSLAAAFNHASDPLGVPVLVRLADHPDDDVRETVAISITSCRTFEDDEDTAPILDTLLRLMVDDQADVRNWATFGVGHQLDDDGVIIRDALSDRLDDTDYDTRWEAIIGLARRHDPRVLVPLRDALIEGGEIPFFGIVAAGWLADPRLLQPLQALTEQSEEVQEAIGRCDPSLAARRVTAMTDLLETLTTDAERSEQKISVSIYCPLLENSVELTIAIDGKELELGWDVETLLEHRCAGDPARAAAAVLADLSCHL